MRHQVRIPDDLDKDRYISGKAALNLPAPEETSGDWHFINTFYTDRPKEVFIAGRNGKVDTNAVWGNFGVYPCKQALARRNLQGGEHAYAANHFRAILDLLYESLQKNRFPGYLQGASEEYLDTPEQKSLLLEKARILFPFLSSKQRELLDRWLKAEQEPGYKA